MAQAYDARAQQTAWRALRPIAAGGKGQAVTVSTAGDPVTNEDTGVITQGAPIVDNGCGVEGGFSAQLVNGDTILASDRKFTLAALDDTGKTQIAAPIAGKTTLTIGGKAWRVINSKPSSPAGLPILYTLQLRS